MKLAEAEDLAHALDTLRELPPPLLRSVCVSLLQSSTALLRGAFHAPEGLPCVECSGSARALAALARVAFVLSYEDRAVPPPPSA